MKKVNVKYGSTVYKPQLASFEKVDLRSCNARHSLHLAAGCSQQLFQVKQKIISYPLFSYIANIAQNKLPVYLQQLKYHLDLHNAFQVSRPA